MRVCTDIYSDIQKHHCEKAEMGLNDPNILSGHVSFDGRVHVICVLYFKDEQVLLLENGYCHSEDINQFMLWL